MTSKQKYLNLARDMAKTQDGTKWLRNTIANPSAHMRWIHIALIKLALRESIF